MSRVVVYGAGGYTGRLVTAELAALDLDDLVLGGRDLARLGAAQALAPRARVQAARVDSASELDELCRGARVVISTAGPFERLGEPLVRAALRAGAHFLDTTGEQPYMARVLERYHGSAVERGVAVINAHGFEYALGYAVGALAAEACPGATSLDVYNEVKGFGTSRGTQKSALGVLTAASLERRAHRLVTARPGLSRPAGASGLAVPIPGGEALHLARSFPELGRIRTHLVLPAPLALAASSSWLFRPLLAASVAAPLRQAIERRIDAGSEGPADAARRRVRYRVLAEARGPAGEASAEVSGRDVYGVTGVLIAQATRRLLREAPRATGVVSGDRAFGARELLGDLAPHGAELTVTRRTRS